MAADQQEQDRRGPEPDPLPVTVAGDPVVHLHDDGLPVDPGTVQTAGRGELLPLRLSEQIDKIVEKPFLRAADKRGARDLPLGESAESVADSREADPPVLPVTGDLTQQCILIDTSVGADIGQHRLFYAKQHESTSLYTVT